MGDVSAPLAQWTRLVLAPAIVYDRTYITARSRSDVACCQITSDTYFLLLTDVGRATHNVINDNEFFSDPSATVQCRLQRLCSVCTGISTTCCIIHVDCSAVNPELDGNATNHSWCSRDSTQQSRTKHIGRPTRQPQPACLLYASRNTER